MIKKAHKKKKQKTGTEETQLEATARIPSVRVWTRKDVHGHRHNKRRIVYREDHSPCTGSLAVRRRRE